MIGFFFDLVLEEDDNDLSQDEVKEDIKDEEDKEPCNKVNFSFLPHPKIETTCLSQSCCGFDQIAV